MPYFTVIISTYNRRSVLPRAIESVLSQTFRDFELLVIDNGSTDGTESVAKSIRDKRVNYIKNPHPTDSCDGPRNMGIRMAKGILIAFLDDDDIWYPDRLEKVKRAFDEHADVSAVCHNEHRKIDGRVEGVVRYGPWSEDIHERLLYEGNCLSSCGTTVKRDTLRELGGFDERNEFLRAADYDFWIRLTARKKKIHFIDEPLGAFVLTGYNYSTVDSSFGATIAYLVKTHICGYEKRPVYALSRRGMRRLFQLYAIAGRSFLRSRRLGKAALYLFISSLFIMRRPVLLKDLFKKVFG